jgi:hypothetical protein
MASQVLSGSSNPSYTNNTGQNVRLLLNVLDNLTSISWANVTTDLQPSIPGKLAAYNTTGAITIGSQGTTGIGTFRVSPPYQLSLAPGQSFSAVCDKYNIIVIKEDGS